MAHLWIRETDDWTPVVLVGEEVSLSGTTLLRSGDAWLLLPRDAQTRVNGSAVPATIRLLRDRDEISGVSTEPAYFSTERLAEIVPMPDLGRAVVCPRCRTAIEPAQPAVECPGCGLFHHETAEKNCWSYAPACGSCPRPTGEVGYQWTPEGLL